jgi:hypothetical protein
VPDNDNVLKVKDIEISVKHPDQVTDMMIATNSNLTATVRPANQHNIAGNSQPSGGSSQSTDSSLFSNPIKF